MDYNLFGACWLLEYIEIDLIATIKSIDGWIATDWVARHAAYWWLYATDGCAINGCPTTPHQQRTPTTIPILNK